MKGWNNRGKFGVAETIFEEDSDDEDAADGDDIEYLKRDAGGDQVKKKKKKQQQQQQRLVVVEEDSEEDSHDDDIDEDDDDDDDDDDVSHPPLLLYPQLSPLISNCPPASRSDFPDLYSIVQSWSVATRRRPDVKIHVKGTCFHLHKDVVSSKSGYLKRQLTQVSEITLPDSLKITSDTFNLIAEFCYNHHELTITPFNVAALRTASEALEMVGYAGDGKGRETLRQNTESYFCRYVVSNRDFALIVFRSCLPLLPEAEETAFLASRCLEVLCSPAEEDGGGRFGVGEEMKTVRPEDFLVIAESMQRRFTRSHDILYRAVDLYLKVYDGKMSEQQKTRICCCIDCNMLSPRLLVQAVQNPRMPLRFVVQVMLMEQLNTHRSIWTNFATTARSTTNPASVIRDDPLPNTQDAPSLGTILQRDAALRQVAQLKASINTTTSRIHSLEKELTSMKKRLIESEKHRPEVDSGRSSSFRLGKENDNHHKIGRGGRGSISSGNLSYRPTTTTAGRNAETPQLIKKSNLGQRLIKGIKNVFWISSRNSAAGVGTYSVKKGKEHVNRDDADVLGEAASCTSDGMIQGMVHTHDRTRSVS